MHQLSEPTIGFFRGYFLLSYKFFTIRLIPLTYQSLSNSAHQQKPAFASRPDLPQIKRFQSLCSTKQKAPCFFQSREPLQGSLIYSFLQTLWLGERCVHLNAASSARFVATGWPALPWQYQLAAGSASGSEKLFRWQSRHPQYGHGLQ